MVFVLENKKDLEGCALEGGLCGMALEWQDMVSLNHAQCGKWTQDHCSKFILVRHTTRQHWLSRNVIRKGTQGGPENKEENETLGLRY